MATVKKSVFEVRSMKDAGYQSAVTLDNISTIARFVVTQFPNFAEIQSDDAMKDLREGWALRYSELHPGQRYTQEWNPIPDGAKDIEGMVTVTLAFALELSQQEFGKLKNTEPLKHGAIKSMRDGFSDYVSEKKKALIAAIKKLDGKTRTRQQADDWKVAFTKTLDSYEKRCKAAAKRGDKSAPDAAKYRLAVQRFWETLAA